jgi:hypothetical protein
VLLHNCFKIHGGRQRALLQYPFGNVMLRELHPGGQGLSEAWSFKQCCIWAAADPAHGCDNNNNQSGLHSYLGGPPATMKYQFDACSATSWEILSGFTSTNG